MSQANQLRCKNCYRPIEPCASPSCANLGYVHSQGQSHFCNTVIFGRAEPEVEPAPRPTPEAPQSSRLYHSHNPAARNVVGCPCCDAERCEAGDAPASLCADCGKPESDSGMHFEAPGTNWGAALHHFRPVAPVAQPAVRVGTSATGANAPAAPSPAGEHPVAVADLDAAREWFVKQTDIPQELHGIKSMKALYCIMAAYAAHLHAEVRAETLREMEQAFYSRNHVQIQAWLREQLGKG